MNEEMKILEIDDTKYETILTKKFLKRKNYQTPNPKQLFSFIPGTIVELYVKQGDLITKGDRLLLLEAMKMKNMITASLDGRIKKINISQGERVPKSHLLIEFE
jgi:biotin carboxyl carrier protein